MVTGDRDGPRSDRLHSACQARLAAQCGTGERSEEGVHCQERNCHEQNATNPYVRQIPNTEKDADPDRWYQRSNEAPAIVQGVTSGENRDAEQTEAHKEVGSENACSLGAAPESTPKTQDPAGNRQENYCRVGPMQHLRSNRLTQGIRGC